MRTMHAVGGTVVPLAAPACGHASAGAGEESVDPVVFSLLFRIHAGRRHGGTWLGRGPAAGRDQP
jgi:hypothetical protein